MRNLLGIIIFICLIGMPAQAYSRPAKAIKPVKERMVLMQLRVADEDRSLLGAMETALLEGLQQKYEVFSGEVVAQKAKAVFLKESRTAIKKDCDETRCMQDIAEAFQAELIATANVTKRSDGYFLALSVQNIFDNKVVYSKSTPCKNCDAYQVIDKLKELSGTSPVPLLRDAFEETAVAANKVEPENDLWGEVQKGNTADDYTAYLKQYPKGKFAALAMSRIKKAQEETASEAGRKELQAWQSADQATEETSYSNYLKNYPQGRYKDLAQARINKLQADRPAREEQALWVKAQAGDSAQAIQAYLSQYPNGNYVRTAREKLAAIQNILAVMNPGQIPVKFVANPVVIKFSHVVAPSTPKGKAAERFKQLVEERSKGEIKVEIYPNSQLYKDREELEALQLGAVQMLAPSTVKFGLLGVREFELFDLPFIFPNKETLYRTMDGVVGKRLFNKLEAKGITGLAFWDNGFKQMSANKTMRKVADFNGLKMRIQSSRVLDAQIKALGAMPQVMAFSEVYTALQQGVVDGTENPISNMYTQKMHEVQKHLTLSDHGYLGYAVITNKKFWDGLTSDQRSLLAQAMKDTTIFERIVAQQESDESLEKIHVAKTTEIYTLTETERAEWIKALLPVHKEFEEVVGKENIQGVYDIADQVAKQKI